MSRQAITGYRETERGLRGGAGRALLLRVSPAFPARSPPRPSAHVLDLLPGGRVGPHVDSVKVGPGVPGGILEGLGVPGGFWVGKFWGPGEVLRGLRCVRPPWPPQFCGCTIAGVSLLSPSVLRLRSLRDPQDWLELLLEPGSLYILRWVWGSSGELPVGGSGS